VQPDGAGERTTAPLLRGLDCVRLPVPDLGVALAFYGDALGQPVVWRSATAVGLRLAGDAELVLQTERPRPEIDLVVDDAELAARRVTDAGGRVTVATFDIPIGRCVVVEDPWGNELTLLDRRNGSLVTGADAWVVGTTGPGDAV
jgi:catechol 2,3-dioxygenase-like lactoylglutathione lyase family enzyme